MNLGFFYWDPQREMFDWVIPFLNRPILWYGFFFAFGFFIAYWVLLYLLKQYLSLFSRREAATFYAEKITLYVIIGAIIGARIGDILFYQDWAMIVQDPLAIFKIWQGGLASHGGAIGILASLYIFSKNTQKKYSYFPYLTVLDLVVVPTALAGSMIRIGNFFNQEVLGTPTDLPWAVFFAHPADGSAAVPRHPVQLYEALFYLATFFFLLFLWKPLMQKKVEGKITGLFLLLVFLFRFCIEFFKEEQSALLPTHSPLTMGQYLSIPLILLGAYLFFRKK